MTARRLFIAGLIAAGCLYPAYASTAFAAETVRIGWLRAPNDLTLGKSRGTLEKALADKGASIEWAGPFAAAAPAFEALNAGSVDITAGSSTSAVAAMAADVPLVVFAYQKMSAAAEGIVVGNASPIVSIKDLAGHSVAVNRGGTGEYLLMRALETNAVDPASVTRVYLSPSDSGASLTQGHVDAWATWDPFVAIAKASYDARVLADGAAIGSDNAVVLVASKAFAKEHADLLRTVFGVVQSDNAWAVAHPDEAGAIWVREMGLPEQLGKEIGANSAVPTTAVSPGDAAQIGQIADWYSRSGIIPRLPDVSGYVIDLE